MSDDWIGVLRQVPVGLASVTVVGLLFEEWLERRNGDSGGDLSRPTLVKAMVRGGAEAWEVITSFCEAIMQVKKGAELDPEWRASDSRSHRRPMGHPVHQTTRDDLRPP